MDLSNYPITGSCDGFGSELIWFSVAKAARVAKLADARDLKSIV